MSAKVKAMKQLIFALVVFVLSFAVGGILSKAHATTIKSTNADTEISQPVNDDTLVSGQNVIINAPINGELLVSGNTVAVNQTSSRSVLAAGNSVTVENGTTYNALLAGNTIVLKGDVGHDVWIAGSTVTIDPSAHIHGSLHVYGNQIHLNGKIDGDVVFSGQSVESSAVIGGSMTGDASSVSFTGGSIGKDLTYKSNQDATGIDKVTVAGKTSRSALQHTYGVGTLAGFSLLKLLSTIVVGAVLILLFPKKLKAIDSLVRTKWVNSFLTGLVVLVVTPIAVLLLMATYVGIPLAILAFVFYVMCLYFGGLIGHMVLGSWIIDRFKMKQNWWLALILGLAVSTILFFIPIIGWLVLFVLFVAVTLPTFGAVINLARTEQMG